MQNLHCRFVLYRNGQIYSGYFAKFCGLLRIYELYCSSFAQNASSCVQKNEGASLRILDLTAGCTWIYIAYFWRCFFCLGIKDDSLLSFCYQSWFVKTSLGAPEWIFSKQVLSPSSDILRRPQKFEKISRFA